MDNFLLVMGNNFFSSTKIFGSAGSGRTCYPFLYEPNIMGEGEGGLLPVMSLFNLGEYFFLSTKLFESAGRSEENWC